MPGSRLQISSTFGCSLRVPHQQHAVPAIPKSTQAFSKLSALQTFQDVPRVVEEKHGLQKKSRSAESPAEVPTEPENAATPGAMSMRLAEATEDAILQGGRAGRRAVEEAGFSEELKQRLLDRVEAQKFNAVNTNAIVELGMPSHVGRGSRDVAIAQAWTGTEDTEDTVLRMLDDSRKPLKPSLRGPAKIPTPVIDLRLKRERTPSAGQRLSNARDKSSIYSISKDSGMSEKEREEMRKELRERFTPGARAMPNSIRGLAALANERIEDAIARGQFKVSI